ncbi:MAG: hypothetical protein JWN73_4313 [Betaproteobacteria bacterium]|nr:hypothetical protein [Betaproteobacteria bacterium]
MGSLHNFILEDINCSVFFETGTGTGASLEFAACHKQFQRLYSVEIHLDTAERAELYFANDPRIEVVNMESLAALRQILPTVAQDERILFFLDAHFPGEVEADFQGYKAPISLETKLPLEQELELIAQMRGNCRDVILIDDLRIYENGPFEAGNTPESQENLDPASKNIDFAARLFPNRELHRDYRNEGYLIIAPPAQAPAANSDADGKPVRKTIGEKLSAWWAKKS